MTKILIIDDDTELCDLVSEYLEREGFAVEAVQDGAAGVERALSGEFALAVLDVMMPGLNGFEALKQIRAGTSLPVIMLTARGEEIDRIVGLEIGADDYMPKPFNPRELTARMRAVLRRSGDGGTSGATQAQTLSITNSSESASAPTNTLPSSTIQHCLMSSLLSTCATLGAECDMRLVTQPRGHTAPCMRPSVLSS